MNIERFKKVVVRDFHNTYSLFGLSMLIIMLTPVALWMLGLVFGEREMPSYLRMSMIEFVVFLTAAISSMKIYNSCNLVGKGNYFAMLPASLGEKFTSMVLYCFVVCPLVVFAGLYAVDTLLTLLPFGPYREYLWDIPDWKQVVIASGWGYTSMQGFLSTAGQILGVTSLFMLANTIFKKNKFIKTVLWLMLIGFIAIVVLVPIMSHIDWNWEWWVEKMMNLFKDADQRTVVNIMFWTKFIFDLAVSAVLLLITYRRLKKMQY